jgi:hypothetical protein
MLVPQLPIGDGRPRKLIPRQRWRASSPERRDESPPVKGVLGERPGRSTVAINGSPLLSVGAAVGDQMNYIPLRYHEDR